MALYKMVSTNVQFYHGGPNGHIVRVLPYRHRTTSRMWDIKININTAALPNNIKHEKKYKTRSIFAWVLNHDSPLRAIN